jgi:hypothetical protein
VGSGSRRTSSSVTGQGRRRRAVVLLGSAWTRREMLLGEFNRRAGGVWCVSRNSGLWKLHHPLRPLFSWGFGLGLAKFRMPEQMGVGSAGSLCSVGNGFTVQSTTMVCAFCVECPVAPRCFSSIFLFLVSVTFSK